MSNKGTARNRGHSKPANGIDHPRLIAPLRQSLHGGDEIALHSRQIIRFRCERINQIRHVGKDVALHTGTVSPERSRESRPEEIASAFALAAFEVLNDDETALRSFTHSESALREPKGVTTKDGNKTQSKL